MTKLSDYVQAVETGHRRVSPSGLKGALSVARRLDRPAVLHSSFESWDDFAGAIDLEWRRYPDPFLLTRIESALRSDRWEDVDWTVLRECAGELGRAADVWAALCAHVIEPYTACYWELDRARTGRYPRWRDLYEVTGPLAVRTGVPYDDVHDRVRINVSIDGFVDKFGNSAPMREWLESAGARRLYVDVDFGTPSGGDGGHDPVWFTFPGRNEFVTRRNHGRVWMDEGTMVAQVVLPAELLDVHWEDRNTNIFRARRVFSAAMRAIADHR